MGELQDIIIYMKRNTDVNTENTLKKYGKKGWFFGRYLQFLQNLMWLAFNLMLD